MILLDTDHFNVLQIGKGNQFESLVAAIDESNDQHLVTTVISFEEHMRGWLAAVRRTNHIADQVRPYEQLIRLVRFFQAWEILSLDEPAAHQFDQFRKQRIRIGTMDLKIASITIVNDAILLSANLRDFEQVPGLRVENWLV